MSEIPPVKEDTYYTAVVTLRNGKELKLPCRTSFDEIYDYIASMEFTAFGNVIIRTSEIVTIEHLDPMKIFISKV